MKFVTDVDFGHLTKELFNYLSKQPGVTISLSEEVVDLYKRKENWVVDVKTCEEDYRILTPFIFIGAGGGTLPLLQKSGIEEAKGFGGFPVSGQWLLCKNKNIIDRHHAKVYGKATVGSPPMSVPHLDTRIINGKRELLFGPYAGFSTKFLKEGSNKDLFKSVKANNILPLLQAGIHNIPLTKYLINQVTQSQEDRIELLKEYFPNVESSDWELGQAGQRVQVIKKTEHGGVLEFGTEMVISDDKSISALLGASPGASTAVSIMVSLIEKCFGPVGIDKLIPTYITGFTDDIIPEVREKTNKTLDLVS